MIVLETARLSIRTFAKNDFRNFLLLNQDPEVMEYFDEGVKPTEKLRIRFNEIIAHQEKHGFSYCNFFLKGTNEYIGQGGMYYNFDMTINVCYALLKKFRRQGYATEAISAILDWGFKNFNINDECLIRSAIGNVASISFAHKLGGVFAREAITRTGFRVKYFSVKKDAFYKKYPQFAV